MLARAPDAMGGATRSLLAMLIRALIAVSLVTACAGGGPTYRTLTDASASPTPAPTVTANVVDVPAAFQARYAAARAATTLFHVRFDQRNFARIYAAADPSLRTSTSEAGFTARLGALRDRTGATRGEEELAVDIVERSPDLIVTLVMGTDFENGVLTETFVWRVTPDETPYLVRYDTR